MTILGCMDCGAVFELEQVYELAAEFDIVEGKLRCPLCTAPLYDVSPEPLPPLDPLWYEGMAAYDLSLA